MIVCQTAVCLALLLSGALDSIQPPPIEEMPLFLSWYDPALCLNGGNPINCDADPSVMAGGTAVTDDMYGYAAACIPEWFDRTLTIPGIGTRHCLDTGGDVKIAFREVYTADGLFIRGWCTSTSWHTMSSRQRGNMNWFTGGG
jgi:hypothetical protein